MANNIFTGNGLKMGHVNTRSLLKHQHEIFLYMRGIDVLGISETWLKPIINDAMIYENGYAIVRQDSCSVNHAKAIVNTIQYKQSIKVKIVTVAKHLRPLFWVEWRVNILDNMEIIYK